MHICMYRSGVHPCSPGACTPSSDDLTTQPRFEPHGRERVGVIPGSLPRASCSSPFSSPSVLQNSSEKMHCNVFADFFLFKLTNFQYLFLKTQEIPPPILQMNTHAHTYMSAYGSHSAHEGRKMRRNALHGPGVCWAREVGKRPINHTVGQQECNVGCDPFGDSPSVCRSIHVTGLGAWATEGGGGDGGVTGVSVSQM